MGSGKKRWLLPVQIALALMGVAALFALSAYRGHRKALERLFERPAARVEAGRARWMDGARYEYDEGERDDDRDLRLV